MQVAIEPFIVLQNWRVWKKLISFFCRNVCETLEISKLSYSIQQIPVVSIVMLSFWHC